MSKKMRKEDKSLDERMYTDYNPEDGWTEDDIKLHKETDWKARNWEELDAGDEFKGEVVIYRHDREPEKKEVTFHKFLRPNPIYPPYYRAVDFDVADVVGPMYDGRKHGSYDIHDRYEDQTTYDFLSDSLKEEWVEKDNYEGLELAKCSDGKWLIVDWSEYYDSKRDAQDAIDAYLKKESLKEAEDDDLSDDELDALDAEEEKAFRQKLADRRARVAGKRKEKEDKKAKLDAILKEIGKEFTFEKLIDKLVPDTGKADTVAGELVRALHNIDAVEPFFVGEGLEYDGAYMAFIENFFEEESDGYENKVASEISDSILDVAGDFETYKEPKKYGEFLKKLEDDLVNYIKDHNELLVKSNENDSRTKFKGEDYWEEYIPTFDIEDCALPPELIEYLELEVIDTDDVRWKIQDIIMGLEGSTEDVDVFDDYCDVHGLSKNDFDALGGESAHELYDWLEEYASKDLEYEYGTPDEIREKREEEESEDDDDDDTDESLNEGRYSDLSKRLADVEEEIKKLRKQLESAESEEEKERLADELSSKEIEKGDIEGALAEIRYIDNGSASDYSGYESLDEAKDSRYVWKKLGDGGDDWFLVKRGEEDIENNYTICLSRMNRYFPWSIYVGDKEDVELQAEIPYENLKDIKEYILEHIDEILAKHESLHEDADADAEIARKCDECWDSIVKNNDEVHLYDDKKIEALEKEFRACLVKNGCDLSYRKANSPEYGFSVSGNADGICSSYIINFTSRQWKDCTMTRDELEAHLKKNIKTYKTARYFGVQEISKEQFLATSFGSTSKHIGYGSQASVHVESTDLKQDKFGNLLASHSYIIYDSLIREEKEIDDGPEHGYASVEDYERAQEILDEMTELRNKEAEEGDKLLRAWAVEKSISDEEFHKRSDKLHKETQEKVEALFKELKGLTEKSRAKKESVDTSEKEKYTVSSEVDTMITEAQELSSDEIKRKIESIKTKQIPAVEERIAGYKKEQEESKDDKRKHTLDNKIRHAENELRQLNKRIEELEKNLETALASESEALRKQAEERVSSLINPGRGHKIKDDSFSLTKDEKKAYEDFTEYLKDKVTYIVIETSPKTEKLLRRVLPDLKNNQYVVRKGTTSGGNPMKFGISAVLHAKDLDECPAQYKSYFNEKGDITEVSKVFPLLRASFDVLEDKIRTHEADESLKEDNEKMKPTIYNILGWLANHKEAYGEFKKEFSELTKVDVDDVREWIAKHDELRAEYEEFFDDKLPHIETIELPHEEYTEKEDIIRINNELDEKAKAGKLIGIRKEKDYLQLAEPEINGIWTLFLDENGYITKITLW